MSSSLPLYSLRTAPLAAPLQSALVSLEAALGRSSASIPRRQWLRQGYYGLMQRQRQRATWTAHRSNGVPLLASYTAVRPDDAGPRQTMAAALLGRQRWRPRPPQSLPARYFSSSRSVRDSQSPAASTSSSSSASATDSEADKDTSLKGRLKTLMRKYGWATVVVYLLFSVVDFGIAFFAINLVGAEHVRRGQDYILDTLVYGTADESMRVDQGAPKGSGILGFLKDWREKKKLEAKEHANESKKGGSGGVWATAVLAYTIHKTLFLPVRLGATAAATPAIVKQLQKWGINIARAPIPESVKQRGAQSIKSGKDRLDRARSKHGDWL